jgi:hypothetical protein
MLQQSAFGASHPLVEITVRRGRVKAKWAGLQPAPPTSSVHKCGVGHALRMV